MGNPAAICPLEEWSSDQVMQAIAAKNKPSEAAFFVQRPDGEYDLRWFTPKIEIDLYSHATLVSGRVVLTKLTPDEESVAFHTRSGRLTVLCDGDRMGMDFPAQEAPLVTHPELLAAVGSALGKTSSALHVTYTIMVVFDHHSQVASLKPDFAAIGQLDIPYIIVTVSGENTDFVSRFFASGAGIDEDPVTGSTHTIMAP